MYKTKDLYLAATLLALSFPLSKIDKTSKPYIFYFKKEREPFIAGDTLTPKKVEKAFWNDQLSISPKKVLFSLKELKQRLYSIEQK